MGFPMSASQDASVEYNQLKINVCKLFHLGAFGCFITLLHLTITRADIEYSKLDRDISCPEYQWKRLGSVRSAKLVQYSINNVVTKVGEEFFLFPP